MGKWVRHPFASAREFRHSPQFGRFIRYSLVSVVSTVTSLGGLYLFFRVLHVGSAAVSNLIATSIASVPAYYLNRTWSWGKTGRSHFMREIAPFWMITILGIVLSTIVVRYAQREAHHFTHTHMGVTIIVELANFGTYAFLWVGKFVVFNKYLFKAHDSAPPAPMVAPTAASASASATAPASLGDSVTVAQPPLADKGLRAVELS